MKAATIRAGTSSDATSIAALSIQVFLDTYATEGVRPDLGREALTQYSAQQFEQRLADQKRSFILAERGEGLLGFAEVDMNPSRPPIEGSDWNGLELVRLYIQPSAQRMGLGRRLLRESEIACETAGRRSLWLTVWSGNARALMFYKSLGYVDVGVSTYTFEGNAYDNRVLAKELGR